MSLSKEMIWISDRNPFSPGLYGVLFNSQRSDPFCFMFAYWDGNGWKIASESDIKLVPYRPVKTWCKLQIGTDLNGND